MALLAIGEGFKSPSWTFVGSSKIGRVPDPGLFFTPSYNKRLALPTAGIVSVAISSKTRFVEWHASRGG